MSNEMRMSFGEWLYRMHEAGVPAHARILAVYAAVFDVTGNDELAALSGMAERTYDKWKKILLKDGWVLVGRRTGGRGLGVVVHPSIGETPVTFTDVIKRNPRKIYPRKDCQTPAEITPVTPETPAKLAQVTADTPAEITGVNVSSRACIETPTGLLTLEEIDTPLPPKVRKLSDAQQALEAFTAYNEIALRCGIPQAAKLTPDRQRKILARLRDYGLDGWARALANIEKSAFLTGGTDHGFRADLDFVCQAKSFGKLHDGGYGNGRHRTAPRQPVDVEEIDYEALRREAGIVVHRGRDG